MNTTLDAVLHDALAQSERFHAGLAAPPVRSTIARKRVVRRAAVSSAATVGAVSIGAGGYAITTGFAPSNIATVGSSASITPTASPSPTPSTTAAADPAALAASRIAFCQELPLITAWTEAAGNPATSLVSTGGPSGDDELASFGCRVRNATVPNPMGVLSITFTFGNGAPVVVTKEKCVDDKGTMTFETNRPTDPSEAERRGIACIDDALVMVEEAIEPTGDFTLTDAQIKANAEASVAMADKARLLAR